MGARYIDHRRRSVSKAMLMFGAYVAVLTQDRQVLFGRYVSAVRHMIVVYRDKQPRIGHELAVL